jgi:hypothetical protein
MTDTGWETFKELRAFRKKLEVWARSELERQNPRYVQAFSQRLDETGDLDGVIKETAHLLGDPPDWYPLLTALADTELALDRVLRAVWFLDVAPPPGLGEVSNPGAWVVYHHDQWTFAMYALLERLRRLTKLTVRKLIRGKNAQWRDVQAALLAPIEKLSNGLGTERHPLTHGGGVVEELEADRFWEPYLMRGIELAIGVPEAFYQTVRESGYQERSHGFLEGSTKAVIDVMEIVLRRLSRAAFGDP